MVLSSFVTSVNNIKDKKEVDTNAMLINYIVLYNSRMALTMSIKYEILF